MLSQVRWRDSPLNQLWIAAVAATSLDWNIYRVVVQKPQLHVHVTVGQIAHSTFPENLGRVAMTVTNFGPGKTQATCYYLGRLLGGADSFEGVFSRFSCRTTIPSAADFQLRCTTMELEARGVEPARDHTNLGFCCSSRGKTVFSRHPDWFVSVKFVTDCHEILVTDDAMEMHYLAINA